MPTENAKQRDIRAKIEELVQEHVNASDEWADKGIVVLEVAVAAYGRTPDTKTGGWYGLIAEPFTAPHSTAGLLDFASGLCEQDLDEDL